jgi:phosphomannomutase
MRWMEDIVRVYAEASSRENEEGLAAVAAAIVYRLCDKVGPKPAIFLANRT